MANKKKEMDQLTKDSIAAYEAGMSYGQWMTLRGAPAIKQRVETTEDDGYRKCAICDNRFLAEGRQKKKKYCSRECYERAMSILKSGKYKRGGDNGN